MNEFELIKNLTKVIPRRLQGRLGIGDDAGTFPGGAGEFIFTTDAIVDGVDFTRKARAEKIGYKALAVNLSDLAAMGAKPSAFVVTLGIPAGTNEAWLKKVYRGMTQCAAKYNTLCVGGDITKAKQFFISIALVGRVKKKEAVTRGGARVGDLIGVTGKLGGSITRHHLDFAPRLKEGSFLAAAKVHAMIDISDGLLQDLGHILESSGRGALLDSFRIPVSEDAKKLAGKNPEKRLEHACTDGEDFELLFTAAPREKTKLEAGWKKKFPGTPLSWIGEITKDAGKIRWQKGGMPIPAPRFKQKGYSHF